MYTIYSTYIHNLYLICAASFSFGQAANLVSMTFSGRRHGCQEVCKLSPSWHIHGDMFHGQSPAPIGKAL